MKRLVTPSSTRGQGRPKGRPSLAIFHPGFRLGAVAATCLWTIEALKSDFAITVVSGRQFDLDELNQTFGTEVMPWDYSHRPLPIVADPLTEQELWEDYAVKARKVADEYDVCITLAIPVDLSRQAVHLVSEVPDWLSDITPPLRTRWGRRLLNSSATVPTGLLAANSRWTAGQIESLYQVKPAVILPPPVHVSALPLPGAEDREAGSFLMLGHFSPDKRIDMAIRILSDVRAMGHQVTLNLAGRIPEDHDGANLRGLINQYREWVFHHGPVSGHNKEQILRRCAFGLSCHQEESFGLGVAEMAASGCLPLVPSHTGAAEIVAHELFTYRSPSDAAEKIDHLLRCPWQRPAAEAFLQERALRFPPQRFMEGLRLVVGSAHSLTVGHRPADSGVAA